jgi:hypothetical protein
LTVHKLHYDRKTLLGFVVEKNSRWRIGPVAIAGAVIAAGALSVASLGTVFGSCQTAVLNTVPSPDGHRSIVIFRKQCAATVPYSTQASIAPSGTAFSADKIPAFFVVAGTPAVTANWLGNTAVEISSVPNGGKVFRSQQSVGDITIAYK